MSNPDQSYERMFHAACLDLAAINEALDLDPDDGGAVPILEAIAELKSRVAPTEAAAMAATVPAGAWSVWEALPGYLIDNCEGTPVSEEMLQRALESMLKDPKYAAPQAPVAGQPAEPSPACLTCSDHGVVGRAPDDYYPCPDCAEARLANAMRTAAILRLDIEHGSPLDNSNYVRVSRCGIEMARDPISVVEEIEDEQGRVEAVCSAGEKAAVLLAAPKGDSNG